MNPVATIFLLLNALALFALPRRWAVLPLVTGACYLMNNQIITVAVFHLSVLRLLIAVGIVRALVRGERPGGGLNRLDFLFIAWAAWALLSSFFHEDPSAFLVNSMGLVYNACGLYFLVRCFCNSMESAVHATRLIAILLIPVALEMVSEQVTGRNLFALLGDLPDTVAERTGRFRAQGPFSHAILAGTVGATCLPLMLGLWRREPLAAKTGIAACLLMILASASSGPIMSAIVGVVALAAWRWRHLTRQMRIGALLMYALLELVMKAPAYYLIARVDLVGGSTGWHRARLIQSAIEHLDEWWIAGTDYTRHWMASGVPWSEQHTDITNHFLAMGVRGGLLLMLLFILILWRAFLYVGQAMRNHDANGLNDQFFIWTWGASLFAHAATCISVAYFDQSAIFLYLDLAVIGSMAFDLSPARHPEIESADVSEAAPVTGASDTPPDHLPSMVSESADPSSPREMHTHP